jgi:hypothetical protein
MTAPLNQTVLRLPHTDTADLVRKLRVILGRLGYRVEAENPVRMTVGELAKMLHRPVSTVSRSFKRPSCPPFVCQRGKRRILWLEPNDRLLAYLTPATPVKQI